jgi:4-hydroxybenzoate polyprenyltransferase
MKKITDVGEESLKSIEKVLGKKGATWFMYIWTIVFFGGISYLIYHFFFKN